MISVELLHMSSSVGDRGDRQQMNGEIRSHKGSLT